MKDFSNLDGALESYDVLNADSPVSDKYFDADNFYPANGEETSNFLPLVAAAATQTRAGQRLVKGTALDKKERAKRRAQRQSRKDLQVKGQYEAAKGLAKSGEQDAALLKAMSTKPTTKEKKMSTTTIVLIAVAGLAVVGVGAYFLLRGKGKNK